MWYIYVWNLHPVHVVWSENMNHSPQGILYFLKSLIMWSLFKGTRVGLVCIHQCISMHTESPSSVDAFYFHSCFVSTSNWTGEETSLAFHSICLEDLIKQEENSSWYFGLALAEEVWEATHTLRNIWSFTTLVAYMLNAYCTDPTATTQHVQHKRLNYSSSTHFNATESKLILN